MNVNNPIARLSRINPEDEPAPDTSGDCGHGCNGDCLENGSDDCTFTCHMDDDSDD